MFLSSSPQLAHVMRAVWGRGQQQDQKQHPPGKRPPLLLPPVGRCLAQVPATGFHRFLARFSGRRRRAVPYHHKSPPLTILVLVIVVSSLCSIVDACSSRTAPKPRPPTPRLPTPRYPGVADPSSASDGDVGGGIGVYPGGGAAGAGGGGVGGGSSGQGVTTTKGTSARPTVTIRTYQCSAAYSAWYCMNGATCFALKLNGGLLYNCECAEGYMGPRCEFKDLDGNYYHAQKAIMLERASIASGALIAVFLVVTLCLVVYIQYVHRTKAARVGTDCVDGGPPARLQPTFGTRWRTTPQSNPELPITSANVDRRTTDLHQVTTLLSSPRQHQTNP